MAGPGPRLVATLALVALGGCGDGAAQGPTTKLCDPLADQPQPITLGKVLGVGRDATGVLYVIDQPPTGSDRLFVSDGIKTLTRQPVRGTGETNSPDGTHLVIVDAGTLDAQLNVEIVTDPAGTVTMGLVRGAIQGKTFSIGAVGETLEVVGVQTLGAYTLENLPGTIDVEYLATLADGRTMVVTRPDVDWSYADFRLFLSESAISPLLERKVTNVARGSFTIIDFDLDGVQAEARFSSSLAPGPSTLTMGADTLELTVAASGTRPTGVTFLCR